MASLACSAGVALVGRSKGKTLGCRQSTQASSHGPDGIVFVFMLIQAWAERHRSARSRGAEGHCAGQLTARNKAWDYRDPSRCGKSGESARPAGAVAQPSDSI